MAAEETKWEECRGGAYRILFPPFSPIFVGVCAHVYSPSATDPPPTSPFAFMPLPYVSYETRGSIAASDKKGRSGEEGEGVFKEGEREYKQRR